MSNTVDLQPGDQERTPSNPLEMLLPMLQGLKTPPAPASDITIALEVVRDLATALVRSNDLLQRLILEDRAATRMKERE